MHFLLCNKGEKKLYKFEKYYNNNYKSNQGTLSQNIEKSKKKREKTKTTRQPQDRIRIL